MSTTKCIVVFPVYKSLSEREIVFFEQALRMTSAFDHVFVVPQSFVADFTFDKFDCKLVRFHDSYFKTITGYNLLMLSSEFYSTFRDYEYMLVHQADVYLFRPELERWCDSGYDYIGAPWLKPSKRNKAFFYNFILKYVPFCYSAHKRKVMELYDNVGNGGLSLRKIDVFIETLDMPQAQNVLSLYKERLKTDTLYNEDIFWSVEAPRINRHFRKPDWQEALPFAIETHAAYAYDYMGQQLPFGCHAPEKYEPEFWDNFIRYEEEAK